MSRGADGCAKAIWLTANTNMTEKKNIESRRDFTVLSFHLISSKIKAVLRQGENITATHNLRPLKNGIFEGLNLLSEVMYV